MSNVQQQLYIKTCTGTTFPTDCEGEDPFAGSQQSTGDGASLSATGLSANTWYIGSVRMQWRDENNSSYTQTGLGYDSVSSPSNGGTDDGRAIIFKTDTAPVCTLTSLQYDGGSNDPCDACCGCCPDSDYRDTTTVTPGTTKLWTNSGCTTAVSSQNWVSFTSGDGGPAYQHLYLVPEPGLFQGFHDVFY